MNPRSPTEEEKAEIVDSGSVLEYTMNIEDESARMEAARELIEDAAIAVFDDYSYVDIYEEKGESVRREYKKLVVVVFSKHPFEPKIFMLGHDEQSLQEFGVIGEEEHITYEQAMIDFAEEEMYQRWLNKPEEEREEVYQRWLNTPEKERDEEFQPWLYSPVQKREEDNKQLSLDDRFDDDPFKPDFPDDN